MGNAITCISFSIYCWLPAFCSNAMNFGFQWLMFPRGNDRALIHARLYHLHNLQFLFLVKHLFLLIRFPTKLPAIPTKTKNENKLMM